MISMAGNHVAVTRCDVGNFSEELHFRLAVLLPVSSEKMSRVHSCMKALVNILLTPPPDGKLLHSLPSYPQSFLLLKPKIHIHGT